MPKDTNALGTIFGGIILSYIDQAGAVEAHRSAPGKLVTVAMREVEFLQPVFVGDVLSLYGDTTRIGRTSLTIRVRVSARRRADADQVVEVTQGEVVIVAVDDDCKPIPV